MRVLVQDEEILSRRLRRSAHDGPVVGVWIFNDLTHLFTLQLGAHLLSAALADGADKAEQDGAEGEESAGVEEDVERSLLNAEDLDNGGRFGAADLHPLLVAGDGGVLFFSFRVKLNNDSVITNLSAVDELSQRDISMVAEDVDITELVGSVLELDAEEVADVGGRAAAELNGNGRGKVGFRQYELDIICYIGK